MLLGIFASPMVRYIIVIVVTAIVGFIMALAGEKPAKVTLIDDKKFHILTISYGVRLIIAIIVCFSLLIVYAAFHSSSSQRLLALCIALASTLGSICLIYQLFIKIAYNHDKLIYSTPLRGQMTLSWHDVIDLRFSALTQTSYLHTTHGRIYLTGLQNGSQAFELFCLKKLHKAFR